MDAHDERVIRRPAGSSIDPWLAWLDSALRREVMLFRARYDLAAGELRGMHIGDGQVDSLLADRAGGGEDSWVVSAATVELEALELLAAAVETPGRMRRLAETFGLTPAAVLAIVLCAAPEVDLGYASLYGYLNDDAAVRLPTVDLCRRLTPGHPPLDPDDPVFAEGLIRARRADAAPLWRSAAMVLSEPVRRFVLGPSTAAERSSPSSARRLPHLTIIEGDSDDDVAEVARGRALHAGYVVVEPRPHGEGDALADAVLTARLSDAALFVPAGFYSTDPHGADEALQQLLGAHVPLIIGIRPGTAQRLTLAGVDYEHAVVGYPPVAERATLWRGELNAAGVEPSEEVIARVSSLFMLGPAQIRAASAAVSRSGGTELESVARAARQASGTALAVIAQHIENDCTWDDLVLPDPTLRRLTELAAAIRNRRRVFDAWGFGRVNSGHTAVRALFSGPSGTGKTMSAAVLASDLGLDLYRVDLAAVVSKYIGETEKNLERVLAAAESSNALLLFDEADALFGKRSEVTDAHDRYANIEISFLLQRIEAFDGVLLLATNLPGNLDQAFGRRMHFHLEFPLPDLAARERLWRQAIPADAPTTGDIDFAFLAGTFPLAGGDIRGAVLQAAFLAADEAEPIGMQQVVRAVARLRRRQGKLPSAAEFKQYLRWVRDDDG